ncbi:MAG: hypothetical protein Q8O03_02080 [Nanoarchaeota archaeon]|jgi:predicted ArsR family transcriptional regulator|nr:hypothetical protein [Nanoarchaeota archaeon]
MSKRSSYEIKKKILLALKDKSLSYAQLERKINTGFRTIKSNCQELEQFGQVKIDKIKHPATGRTAYIVSITKQGLKFLEKSH